MHIMLVSILEFCENSRRKALLFLMDKNYITFTVPCILQLYDISTTKRAVAKSVYCHIIISYHICAMEYITCSLVKLCGTTQYSW